LINLLNNSIKSTESVSDIWLHLLVVDFWERVSSLAYYKVGRCLLQDRLDERDMEQVELAALMNVSKQQINKYATNKQKMSLKVAKNISIILKCSIDDLYEWIIEEAGNNE
jgi:DNA-binding XRE family transcriptional regulator